MASDTVESLLSKLKTKRAKLQASIVRIEAAIAEIEEFSRSVNEDDGISVENQAYQRPSEPIIELSPHAYRKFTIAKASKDYLRKIGTKQTTRQLINALERGGKGKIGYNTVYGSLRRDAVEKKGIVRLDDGWALPEWNP